MFLAILTSALLNCIFAFPDGRCYVNKCDASPYILDWVSESCFTIKTQNCNNNYRYTCCELFNKLLDS